VEAGKNTKNAMAKILKIAFLFFTCIGFYSQTNAQVTIKIDETINEQLRLKNARIDTTRISGYRIQIAFNSNMTEASKSKSSFDSKFPEYGSYLLYQQPYWKVRVGNFYREIEAQKLLDEVRVYFPDAFVVKDNIHRPK
jgi:hypothetical protein